MEQVKLTLDEVHALATRALSANGCNADSARAVADTVTSAERDGCKSHGLFRIPGYIKSLRSGKANGTPEIAISRPAPSVVVLDADRALAPLAIERGRAPLIEATRETGMAALAIRRAHHFAALWPETEALAEQGLVAMAFVNSAPYVAPAGGKSPFFGTNPMSFAWPRADGRAMVWDQASAAMARGEIQIAKRDGHPLPEGAGIDKDGNPTTDPGEILAGAQLAFGGYKGAAIAMMVDLLVGPLLGEVTSFEAGQEDNGDGGPATGGELILAFDPSKFGGSDAIQRGEAMFARMMEMDGVRLPGARRYQARRTTPTTGIEIPSALHTTIAELAG